ncbi:MAG: valine--tRNA ligase [Elusimicrobia bacterium RIFCSPLOWO2_12_FULL_59_9]|nr:MAG: valine--tRNA ligase [Elusimicrobia bacterium RIFCSPLOWO2_12_FULL_59_9]
MLPKVYNPKPTEKKWYEAWVQSDLFSSKPDGDKTERFVMAIPPPNITGSLHMGHALNSTLQDVLTRYHKMRGKNVYWVPGTDHGGIATQNVVEKQLRSEGLTRFHLGREKFLERMWTWRRECGDAILNQQQRMGCAMDLKEGQVRFTMADPCAGAVYAAFEKLWNRGWIYRGKRMINWCVRCGTALSDIEVEHEDRSSKLWHIHYPLENGNPGPVVATTRPETMLGDTAVAVHPEDERHKSLIGRRVKLPLTERSIPVIADTAIDLSFGTGALKVTPAHDPVDHEIGRKHGLPTVRVIGFDGKMTEEAGKNYSGLDRDACRKKVLEDLKTGDFLRDEKPYRQGVSICYRCNQPIEPLESEQWFLKMDELAQPAIDAVKTGKVKFYPGSWEKPYLLWMENLRDWCISRQIWWGHRIPVWYCKKENSKCPPSVSARAAMQSCPHCGHGEMEQDSDVLDTWFSSALWPFSVFGWPDGWPGNDKTLLNYYYPTTVMVTGYEILYLWVARMIMAGLEFMKEVPFKDVYIHGIVRDKHGKKMSKSLGNVIDPLTLMDQYGTDAMRFSLMSQVVPGRDIAFAPEATVGPRNFCNKLYNATRYVLMQLDAPGAKELDQIKTWIQRPERLLKEGNFDLADRWILGRCSETIEQATEALENYRVDEAARLTYEFLWGDYCDWYIEITKYRQAPRSATVLAVLITVLERALKILHPIMPFITEELWHGIYDKLLVDPPKGFLLSSGWPKPFLSVSPEDRKNINFLKGVITDIRVFRFDYNIPPDQNLTVRFKTKTQTADDLLFKHARHFLHPLAKITDARGGVDKPGNPDAGNNYLSPPSSSPDVTYLIPKSEIDLDKTRSRLQKEILSLENQLKSIQARLDNPAFVSRAPEEEVAKARGQIDDVRKKLAHNQDSLQNLLN